jgi:hypothetical protein
MYLNDILIIFFIFIFIHTDTYKGHLDRTSLYLITELLTGTRLPRGGSSSSTRHFGTHQIHSLTRKLRVYIFQVGLAFREEFPKARPGRI